MSHGPATESEIIRESLARMRAEIMSIVFAAVFGLGLFFATVWLVILGGTVVGPHLGSLRLFFPGYSVTWGGSIVGLFYGAIFGAIIGWSLSLLYNGIADLKRRRAREPRAPG